MAKSNASSRLLTVNLLHETDFVQARQRAKQLAEILGFDTQDQTRIATAVSEIARNAYEYGRNGKVEFHFDNDGQNVLRIVVSDQGPGIQNLDAIWGGTYSSVSGMGIGIVGSRRLMDDLQIESGDRGTVATLLKKLPRGATPPTKQFIAERMAAVSPQDTGSALHSQNQEVLRLLNELRERERELSQLNQELKETNRGVMVLYSELEDRAQALQQASEMKSRFISGITHELRTPLNSIVSLAGLLIRRIDGELTPEQEKQVLFIQRSAQNLTEMVNDLLDLAKIEAGKVSTRFAEFTIGDVFSALRGMFRPLVTSDQVALVFDESEVLQTRLYSDEGKLAQILRNFIANALKFTERGRVSVSAWITPDSDIRFSVQDTGIGIAEEHKDLVWQEWGQVEDQQRARPKGSGLGLPLARQLASLLGGSTWLESKAGEGSTFYLELPAAALAAAPETPVASGESVLLVDDDEVARYILRRNLVTLTSATIEEASSAAAARASIVRKRPGIIFLDIVMPEENGLSLAQELRQNTATAEIPIVLVSSKELTSEDKEVISRYDLTFINKKLGDAQDQRVALERALLNIGFNDLHQTEGRR